MMSELIRSSRTVGVAHGEAFQLMLYRDDLGKGADRWIWNSRDGVTPFGLGEAGHEYRHAMGSYVPTYSAVLPDAAAYVFVDYDQVAWRAMVGRRYDHIKGSPKGDWFDPADFAERYPTADDFAVAMPFEQGQPRLITRAEFLAETSSWMGKHIDA